MRLLDSIVLLASASMFGCPVDESMATGTDGSSSDSSGASTSSTTLPTTTSSSSSTSTSSSSTTTDDVTSTSVGTTTLGSSETGVITGSDSSSDSSTTASEGTCAIDILFVVDNSASMEQEQAALLAAIPDFIDDLGDADLHAMVVDVDADPIGLCRDTCDTNPECFDLKDCQSAPFKCFLPCAACQGADFSCDDPEPEACDVTLGAGVVEPTGDGASNMDCDFSSGARYIDASRENFANKLVCAAQVGISSTAATELVMGSMVEAVTAGSDAAACNDGFLRDEAKLVVVFVTDEDDGEGDSPGNPTFWKLQLETAKGGSDENIFVLGIFGDNDQANPICMDSPKGEGAKASPRLRQFVDAFDDNGVTGSVCAGSFAPYFNDLADVLDDSCG